MTEILFNKKNNLESVRSLVDLSSIQNNSIELAFPEDCFIETDAIAFLTRWLLTQQTNGIAISIKNYSSIEGYLARMNFHRVLGLPEPQHGRRPDAGRFIPIMLVRDLSLIHI